MGAIMSDNKLKTAVLGAEGKGLQLVEAAVGTGLYEIVAASDRDPERLKGIASEYKCSSYEDYRQLVVRNSVDVLFVGAPIYLFADQVKAAIEKKFNVLKLVPPGLNFEQTAGFVELARKKGVRYSVANTSRYSPGFNRLREYLETRQLSEFHLITATCHQPDLLDDIRDRWLSDPQLAGGGVVLRSCYELIDQIILGFGIPQQVYSVNTNHAPDRQQRLSITEDTAVLTMRFSDTLLCSVVASRTFGPPERQICLHSDDAFITVSENRFVVCDNHGKVIEKTEFDTTEAESRTKMLEDFAAKILSEGKAGSTLPDSDIVNMAVIESAYLSARTGMAENPGRLLEMVRTEPVDWKSAARKIV